MRTLLICWLALVLAACGGSSSSGSADSSNTPSDGNTDNGGDPGTGDNGGTDNGGDSGGTDNGGDTGGGDPATPQQPDCNWASPAEVTAAETFGNTASASTYDLSSYSERTDLDSDLTGTWVLLHKLTSVSETAGVRTTTVREQRTYFVIRDNGGQAEVAACNTGGGFQTLSDTSVPFSLPVLGAGTQPLFSKTSNSHLDGATLADNNNESYSDQTTQAIKISATTTALGQNSLTYGSSSENNVAVNCYTQQRERSVRQSCSSDPEATSMTLSLLLGTSAGQQGLLYNTAPYYTLSNDNQVMLQRATPATRTVSTGNSSVTINVALESAMELPSGNATSGTLTSSLTLP